LPRLPTFATFARELLASLVLLPLVFDAVFEAALVSFFVDFFAGADLVVAFFTVLVWIDFFG